MQLWTFLRREVRLQIRIVQSLLIDQVLVMLAGAILGALHSEVTDLDWAEIVIGKIYRGGGYGGKCL